MDESPNPADSSVPNSRSAASNSQEAPGNRTAGKVPFDGMDTQSLSSGSRSPTRDILAGDLEQPPQIEGGQIGGVVTDFSGVPLVGVRVEAALTGGAELDLLPVITNNEGAFVLEGLAEGRYDLRFVLGRVKARLLAVPTGTDQLRVKLARPQGLLLVTKTEPGLSVPDLTYFTLDRETPQGLVREHTGRTLKRRVLLWSIRPGRYTVTAWGGPYLPVCADGVEVKEGEPAPEVQIVFTAEGGIADGQVFTSSGERQKAHVAWRRLDEPGHAPRHITNTETDAEGRFLIRGLAQGAYRFSAYSPDCGIVDVEASVTEDASLSLRLQFP